MKAETKQPKLLWWFEPAWSYRSRLKQEISKAVQVRMLPRIAAVSIVLTALLAYGLKRAMPELEFDWAGKFALSFGAVLLSLLCFCGLSSLIPPIIGIKKQGVTRQEGQHVSWRRRADIRRITIDITDPARPRLNIEATNKGPFECGIASKVKAASLADFLRATFPELKVEVNG